MIARTHRPAARAALAAVVPLILLALMVPGCASMKRAAYAPDDRNEWQKPDQVVAALELAPGSRVADLGAGGGYFTFRLADAVGPLGTVYAVDVDRAMLDYIARRAQEEGRANVVTVLAAPDDPELPDGAVDLVFTSNTYHHLPDRVSYFRKLHVDLAPGGRVAVVEYEAVGWFPRLFGHNTDPATIRGELHDAGYGLVRSYEFLPRQSFMIFEPSPPAPVPPEGS